MPLPINTNWVSWNAPNASGPPQGAWHTFMQRLCSSMRLAAPNEPPDFPEDADARTYGFKQGLAGVGEGITNRLHEVHVLHGKQEDMARMHELAIQGAYATSEEEIAKIDAEFTRLLVKHFAP